MQALAALLLPGRDAEDPEVLGTALFLWERIWERAGVAVQNAIGKAFSD